MNIYYFFKKNAALFLIVYKTAYFYGLQVQTF